LLGQCGVVPREREQWILSCNVVDFLRYLMEVRVLCKSSCAAGN
jgi:hypothetical protein